ncbi:MAG: hypothetical protein ACXVEF_08760 [Polyangiales bacterium]
MPTLLARGVREVFRREAIPQRLLWWFAAEGTGDWLSLIRDELAPHVNDVERVLARDVIGPMHARRYQVLRTQFPELPKGGEGLAMGALYRIASYPSLRWAIPGAPAGFVDHVRAERVIAPIPLRARWEEMTCHLGELLIALTERMPPHLPRIRPILGDICFSAGERFAKRFRRIFGMEVTPENALELLRMSEYVFRVNPDHWGAADRESNTGWLTGTACPWWDAPGWNGAHCGIFGQFQSGIASVFGLRYHLTTTIPKHGGHICRIDVKPIPLRKKDAA